MPNREVTEETKTRLKQLYKASKKELKRAISSSKKEQWRLLCSELENDVWGDGYRIAVKHLGAEKHPYSLTTEQKSSIIKDLFPQISHFSVYNRRAE